MLLQTKAIRPTVLNAIVFIDSAVDAYQTLVTAVDPTVRAIVVLDSKQDGILQITKTLQQHSNIDAIHIISHGSPGYLQLGNTHLSLDTLDTYADVLQSWSTAHTPVSLLLYGCNVAAGDAGACFVDRLHQLTGANIAASAHRTGNAALGGDWNLEVTIGEIFSDQIFPDSIRNSYASVLVIDSDDFNSPNLSPIWTFINPLNDGSYRLVGAGTGDAYLELVVPGGTAHNPAANNNRAVRVMQAAANVDFEADVKFGSEPTQGTQMQGILIEQDASNWIRFDVYHNGTDLRIFAASIVNGVSTTRVNNRISPGSASYLRINRTGNQWTLQYSANGSTWTTAVSFSQALTVSSAGTYAGNLGQTSPAYTSRVDYFFNTASPIVPEDGGSGGPVNQPPVASNDTATVAVGSSVTINVLNNDTDSDGTLNAATVAIVNQPTRGTAVVNNNGTITYTPNAGTTATSDSFTYTVRDDDGAISNTATVALTIQTTPPPNQPPVANNDSATVVVGNSVTINVLSNDTDSDGTLNAATVTLGNQPTNGTAVVNNNGTITYTPNAGSTATSDNFTYTVRDDDGAISNTATVALTLNSGNNQSGPNINVWYGNTQPFGQNGKPQVWVNVLGNVSDPDGIAALSYSLNGGPSIALSLGPDKRRLAKLGDFNADIAYDALIDNPNDNLPTNNTVVITARDNLGNVSTKNVTIAYTAGKTWPQNYSIDWSSASSIQDVAQVVDGLWAIEGDKVRILQPDYDRLIGIGDISWSDYEITAPITVNSLPRQGGFGFLMRWQGHTDDPIAGRQPKSGFNPNGAIAWWTYKPSQNFSGPELYGSPTTRGQNLGTPVVGRTYMFKARVETSGSGGGFYSLKIWEAGQPEPAQWSVQQQQGNTDLRNGSLLLISHQFGVSYGDIQITPINGGQTIAATQDSLMASTTSVGELDSLTNSQTNPTHSATQERSIGLGASSSMNNPMTIQNYGSELGYQTGLTSSDMMAFGGNSNQNGALSSTSTSLLPLSMSFA